MNSHPVLKKDSIIGLFTVIFNEYDKFCKNVGKVKSSDQGWDGSNRAVINISWNMLQVQTVKESRFLKIKIKIYEIHVNVYAYCEDWVHS